MVNVEGLNVLLIAIDTLRADRMSCYGYRRKTTPQIDRYLAEEGVVFEEVIAPGIPTHPAYTTIFTGLHPLRHKIVCHGGGVIPDYGVKTMPEVLYENGYITAAVDNLVATRASWFVRGYEYYLYPGGITVISEGAKISGERVTEKAVNFLRLWGEGRLGSRPFFLFIHYWDPHAPYLPPRGFRETLYEGGETPLRPLLEGSAWGRLLLRGWVGRLIEEGYDRKEYVDSLYDEEILYTDYQVSRVIETLKDIGELDETLIILTSDHGEGMGENGIFYDHHGLYDWDVRVPLIMRMPKVLPRDRRVGGLVSHVDIFPTVLDMLGIELPGGLDGESLLPLFGGGRIEGREFIVCVENTRMTKRAIRTASWKLIETLRPDVYGRPAGYIELYNLDSGGEDENLYEDEMEVAHELLSRMEVWYRGALNGGDDPLAVQPISLPIPL